MSSAAGVPGTSASSNCKLKRAAVYVRRRPERSAGWDSCTAENAPAGGQVLCGLAERAASGALFYYVTCRALHPGAGTGISIVAELAAAAW